VLTVRDGEAIPSGPFRPEHRTLELGLRAWVEASTHHPLGYVEQLYTFADRDRITGPDVPTIALSYLALTREAEGERDSGVAWRDWYLYFPWEDRRDESRDPVAEVIAPRLHAWALEASDAETRRNRRQRAELMFGLDGAPWNEEAARARALSPDRLLPNPGKPMIHDHRRILATGLSRLRAKIKYRPVVFELMPAVFTLLQLQQAVEALAGRRLHKQNFRRLVESQGLIEETGELLTETGGRPARLVRFRREVLLQRAAAGTRLSLSRAG
jgi:hypothetical protein